MSTGHTFLVAHFRANSDPLHAVYAVAISDKKEAESILEGGLNEKGTTIKYWHSLSAEEIIKLKLTAGRFRSFWPNELL